MASASPSAAGGSFRRRGQAGAGGELRGEVGGREAVEGPFQGVEAEGAWAGLHRAGVAGEEGHVQAEAAEGEDPIPTAVGAAGAGVLLRVGAAAGAAEAAGRTRGT